MRPFVATAVALLSMLGLAPGAHAARAWAPPSPLAVGDPFAVRSAALLPDGRVAVAWQPSGTRETWAQIVPSGLPPTRLGDGFTPEATVATSGHVLFTWRDGATPDVGTGIGRARTWTAASGLGATIALSGSLSRTLTATNAAGDLVVASGSSSAGAITRFWPANGELGPESPLGAGDLRGLGLGDGGHAVAALQRDPALHAVRRTAGGPVVEDGVVPQPTTGGFSPTGPIAVDATGRAVLTAKGYDGIRGAPVAAFVGENGQWRALPGTPGFALGLQVTTDASGGLVATWADAEGLGLATGSLTTGALGVPQRPATDADGGAPALVTAADGTSLIVFEDTAGSVRVIRRDGAGPFLAPQTAICTVSGGEAHGLLTAGLSPQGDATLVTVETNRGRGVLVTRDGASAAPVDGGCPATTAQSPPIGSSIGAVVSPGAGAPLPFTTTRPAVAVVGGQSLGRVLRRGLRVGVVVAQPTRSTVSLVVSAREARRLRLGRRAVTLGTRTVVLRAGANAVTIRVAKRLRRRLASARKLTVQVRARISARTTLAARATLRR